MSIELKIKSKHLSLESKVIRFEESKLNKQVVWLYKNAPDRDKLSSKYWTTIWKLASLTDHRKNVVGIENRATFLARAYIAGTPYLKVEHKRRDDRHYEFNCKVLPRVLKMIQKYHPDFKVRHGITMDQLKEWCI